jgi:UDPglucose--hexose-1-phosphate uridylyltransferase
MQELRTDEVTGTCVIVAPGRATRPVVFSPPAAPAATALESCPFCPGHEAMTPPEVARVGGGPPDSPGWQVRVVPNLYPIVAHDGGVAGAHEVLVLSPAHDRQLDALSLDAASTALLALRDRTAYQLGAGLVHAQPLLNQGRASGASIEHPHAQLIALAFTPPHVDAVLTRFVKSGRDLVIDSLDAARHDDCLVRDGDAVSWCPVGSASPFIVRLALPTAGARFDLMPDHDIRNLTDALQDTLARLHRALGDIAYNVVVNSAPRDDPRPFHCWIDVVPRIGVIGGFEMGTGVLVNPAAPETAASMLREA